MINDGECEKILRNLVTPITVTDGNSKTIIDMNESAERIFGHYIEKKCYEMCGRNDQCNPCTSEDVFLGKKDSQSDTYQIKDENGENRTYSIRCTPYRNNTNEIVGMVHEYHDITEELKAREVAKAVESEFFHDALGDITIIGGNASGSLRRYLSRGNSEDALKVSDTIVNTTTRLERRLKDFRSSLQSLFLGKSVYKLTDVNTYDFLKSYLKFDGKAKQHVDGLMRINGDTEALYYSNVDDALKGSTMKVDADKFYAIFENLLGNSVKYSKDDGGVSIEIDALMLDEDAIVISVKDNGLGIPLNALTKIFDGGYRLPRDVEGKRRGTGFGLGIVKNFVEGHNGSIQVKSIEGEGSEFIMGFPLYYSDM